MTLTDFLLARIGEDEAVARAAIGHHTDGVGRWTIIHIDYEGSWPYGPDDPMVQQYESGDGWAIHASRHDPARVLAECAAKRRIVEWVIGSQAVAGEPPGFCTGDAPALTYVLRLLASVHADHPDYREEWRP